MNNIRDTFSFWMRQNLKDAYSGLITQDIDFVFLSKNKKKFFFIEEKNSTKARIGPAQKVIFKMFDDLLKEINCGYMFLGTIIITQTEEAPLEDLKEKINSGLNNRMNYDLDKNIIDRLWDCQGKPQKVKTEYERSGYRGSMIKKALNELRNDNILIENINWVFVNYCSGYFIFLEELTYGNSTSQSKLEFIKTIDCIFKEACDKNEARNIKSKAIYKYLGYYELKFSNTNPDNSDAIFINDFKITKEELTKILNLNDAFIAKYKKLW